MQPELQEAIDFIESSCEYEELCATVINFAAQQLALKDIVERADDGEISEDDANVAIAKAIEDHAQAQLDIFDLEIKVLDEEMAEMAKARLTGSIPEVQFNSNTEVLGVILAELIDRDYEDPFLGIMAAADASGLDPEHIQGIIDMQFAPDLPTGEAMALAFPSVLNDPEGMADWMDVVEAAYSEAIADTEDDYSPISPKMARLATRQAKLEAKFNAIELSKDLAEELKELQRQADILQAQNKLTNFEYKQLFGEFADRDDMVAVFSAACRDNEVPVEVQIDRIAYTLHQASQRSGVNNLFAQFSTTWSDPNQKQEQIAKEDEKFAKNLFFR